MDQDKAGLLELRTSRDIELLPREESEHDCFRCNRGGDSENVHFTVAHEHSRHSKQRRCTGVCMICQAGVLLVLFVFALAGFAFYLHAEQSQLRERLEHLEKRCPKTVDNARVAAADAVVDAVVAEDEGKDADVQPQPPTEPQEDTEQEVDGVSAGNADPDNDDDNGAGRGDDEDATADDNGDDDDDDDDDEEEDKEDDEISDDESSTAVPLLRSRRSAKNGGRNQCKKWKKCFEGQESGKVSKECQKILKCAPPATPPSPQAIVQPTVKAVHFMSDFWRDRSIHDFGENEPLNVFKPADWMKDVYAKRSQPIVPSSNKAEYEVKESGLYLIYISVMFHDIKRRQSHVLMVNSTRLFKCTESVDYIDEDKSPDENQADYKSCAMTGVTQLHEGDKIKVVNMYKNTMIDLSKDATYFGAVKLAPLN